MKRIKSWEYDLSKNIAIKNIDKSGFNGGSHLPKEVRPIFDCEDVVYGEKKKIVLEYLGKEYEAYIEREKNNKIRISWRSINTILKNRFENQYITLSQGKELTNSIPKLEFTKIDIGKYDLDLYDDEINNINEFFSKVGIDLKMNDEEIIGGIREYIVKGRKNHSKYREQLIEKDCKCKICGMDDRRLLIASHSKAWIESDEREKVDVNNGFLLCPTHDGLYDKSLISFDDEGKILISKTIDNKNYHLLGIDESIKIDMTKEQLVYVKYHRKKFLEKEINMKYKEIEKYKVRVF